MNKTHFGNFSTAELQARVSKLVAKSEAAGSPEQFAKVKGEAKALAKVLHDETGADLEISGQRLDAALTADLKVNDEFIPSLWAAQKRERLPVIGPLLGKVFTSSKEIEVRMDTEKAKNWVPHNEVQPEIRADFDLWHTVQTVGHAADRGQSISEYTDWLNSFRHEPPVADATPSYPTGDLEPHFATDFGGGE